MADHHIKKVLLDITTNQSQYRTQQLQNQFEHWFQDEVCPMLQNVFDEIVSDNNFLSIDRMEVNLEDISIDQLKREIKNKLVESIKKSIAKISIPHGNSDHNKLLQSNESKRNFNDLNSKSGLVRHRSNEDWAFLNEKENVKESFFYFLLNGIFRWDAQDIIWEEWEKKIMVQLDEPLLDDLFDIFQANHKSVERLVHQFSSPFLRTLEKMVQQKIDESEIQEGILDFKKEKNVKQSLKKMIAAELKRMEPKNDGSMKDFIQKLDTHNWYIENAGIALILPCYHIILDELGWLENGKFKTEEHQVRAAHLLQWINSGEDRISEDQLLLPKIACGILIDKPIKRDIIFSNNIKVKTKECVEYLMSQWVIGKNKKIISPTLKGLRENFLNREGKLVPKSNSWTLIVEPRVTDSILFNTLPWTLSMIKFLWMEKLLKVEWV